MPHLDPRVLAAWDATAPLHEPGPPASAEDVAAAEHALGRHLPAAFVELYLRHDGGGWFRSSLQLLPLGGGDDLSVARASTAHRDWDWPIPDEVVVFGSDGGGDPFGLWLPGTDARPLVVQIGAVFEPGCMAVVGQDLNAFLLGWTAYHLLGEDGSGAGLDALGVPGHLRSDDPGDEEFAAVVDWANPTLAGQTHDPYQALLTAEDVRRTASSG